MIKAKELPQLNDTEILRFIKRIEFTPACWIWKSKIEDYGEMSVKGNTYMAHRLSYELFKGIKIPLDLVIDHLCRNPKCVNPAHLEAVTVTENNLRGFGSPAMNKRKTHCKRGHSLIENRATRKKARECNVCRIMHYKKWYAGWKIRHGKI